MISSAPSCLDWRRWTGTAPPDCRMAVSSRLRTPVWKKELRKPKRSASTLSCPSQSSQRVSTTWRGAARSGGWQHQPGAAMKPCHVMLNRPWPCCCCCCSSSHLIQRQRPSLVGAQNVHGSQVLNCIQPFHDGVLPGHRHCMLIEACRQVTYGGPGASQQPWHLPQRCPACIIHYKGAALTCSACQVGVHDCNAEGTAARVKASNVTSFVPASPAIPPRPTKHHHPHPHFALHPHEQSKLRRGFLPLTHPWAASPV